ncbi:MAG: polymerase subunit delta [Rickettsiales bacterium]|jgi:DNA polymerase-3 subunit delta'|nr:polymerase subunit delta [Rickettsiales bacterium]
MTKETEKTVTLTPRETVDLIGHAQAERLMLQSANSGALHHAWLISGARGIGKATLAYRFARFLLAGGAGGGLFGAPESLALAQGHPLISRIVQGSHPDILVVETAVDEKTGKVAKEIVVDDARKIGKFLSLTPSESDYRIVIIDSIDEMNRNAANSILKLLEEPPARAILLLVSHAPGRLLPTIRSRCRQVKLQPLSQDDFYRVVQTHVPEMRRTEAMKLGQLSEGSPGFAIALNEEKGLALYERLVKLLLTLPQLDTNAAYALGDTVSDKTDSASWQMMTYLLEWLMTRVIRHGIGDAIGEELVPGEYTVVEKLLAQKPVSEWLKLRVELQEQVRDTERVNLDKRQMMVSLLSQIKAA